MIKELPSVPADWSNGDVNLAEKNSLSNGTSLQHAESGTSLRETQSMLLERIASEMNRLKFYIAHAQVFSTLAPSQIQFRCRMFSTKSTSIFFFGCFFNCPFLVQYLDISRMAEKCKIQLDDKKCVSII